MSLGQRRDACFNIIFCRINGAEKVQAGTIITTPSAEMPVDSAHALGRVQIRLSKSALGTLIFAMKPAPSLVACIQSQ